MIVSQLCPVDGFYCNFCWRLIRSSSVILKGLEGIVKQEQPTVDLHPLPSRLHLLAPYARIAAMVGPYTKDVPNLLMSWLQQELEQVGGLTLTGHK